MPFSIISWMRNFRGVKPAKASIFACIDLMWWGISAGGMPMLTPPISVLWRSCVLSALTTTLLPRLCAACAAWAASSTSVILISRTGWMPKRLNSCLACCSSNWPAGYSGRGVGWLGLGRHCLAFHWAHSYRARSAEAAVSGEVKEGIPCWLSARTRWGACGLM